MVKRVFDFSFSLLFIILFSPLFIIFSFMIFLQDWHSPFYIAPRVAKNNKIFKMIKFRSMVINADKNKVDSTSANDTRITRLGHFIRRFKIDELPNFFNILFGQMSFVGPRPNVKRETDLYTDEEKKMLSIRPGVTDIASIVFSDEGEILKDSIDPDLDYNQLIRPWKSRLCLFYLDNNSLMLDIKLILVTVIAIFSKNKALKQINHILLKYSANEKLINISKRIDPLTPYSPPGSNKIVTSRVL